MGSKSRAGYISERNLDRVLAAIDGVWGSVRSGTPEGRALADAEKLVRKARDGSREPAPGLREGLMEGWLSESEAARALLSSIGGSHDFSGIPKGERAAALALAGAFVEFSAITGVLVPSQAGVVAISVTVALEMDHPAMSEESRSACSVGLGSPSMESFVIAMSKLAVSRMGREALAADAVGWIGGGDASAAQGGKRKKRRM